MSYHTKKYLFKLYLEHELKDRLIQSFCHGSTNPLNN